MKTPTREKAAKDRRAEQQVARVAEMSGHARLARTETQHRWDVREVARLEAVLAGRRRDLANVDAEVSRLRDRRVRALQATLAKLNAAKARAAS